MRSNLEFRSYNKDTSSFFSYIPITPNPPRLRSTATGQVGGGRLHEPGRLRDLGEAASWGARASRDWKVEGLCK